MNRYQNNWLYYEEYIVAVRVIDSSISYILACFESEKDAVNYKETTEKIINNTGRTDIEVLVEPIKVFPSYY